MGQALRQGRFLKGLRHLWAAMMLACLLGEPAAAVSSGSEEMPTLLEKALEGLALHRGDLGIRTDLFEGPAIRRLFGKWMGAPWRAPAEAQREARRLLGAAADPVLWIRVLGRLGDLHPGEPVLPKAPPGLGTSLPAPLEEAVQILLGAIEAANERIAAEKSRLTPVETALLERYLYPDFPRTDAGGDGAAPFRRFREMRAALEAARGVDLKGILGCALTVAVAVNEAKRLLTETDAWYGQVRSTRIMTESGLVAIGGTGPDVWEGDAAVVIDLGGDDVYRGRIASGRDGTCSVALDLSGDDLYLGQDETQACGFWGVGILWDLSGDDLYRAGACSQGTGVFGMGLLMDGGGGDTYVGNRFVQAASSWGWAGLVDAGGEDTYQCQYAGQAYAEVAGVSALCDLDGHDKYLSGSRAPDPREADMNQSFSQGFALGLRNLSGGGVAVLADQAGNDLYQCQYFGQGSSYWMGVGVLYDEQGRDTYLARRYAQGAGIHYALGMLLDAAGDDQTISWGVSQGCGHDYGIGVLVNEAGHDTYVSEWLSLGASEANGVGIFSDNQGDDGYETKGGTAVGKLVSSRRAGGIGLFMDAAGTDRYSKRGQDNGTWGENRWSLGMDAEQAGMSGLNLVHPGEPPGLSASAEMRKDQERETLSSLLRQIKEGPWDMKIEGLLEVASHWGFEKEIPKEAGERLLDLSPRESLPVMVDLLDTPDVLSLRFMSRFFMAHACLAVPELINKSTDPEPTVASRALHYLGLLKDTRALDACVRAVNRPSWKVRAAAIKAVGEMLNQARLQDLDPMKAAFDAALHEQGDGPIRDYVENPEKWAAVLSVMARAVPLEYGPYKRYARAGDQERMALAQEFADLAYASAGAVGRLLDQYREAIGSPEPVIIKIRPYLDDADPAVRRAAAYALGQMHDGPSLPRIVALLKDSELWVRDAASLALALFQEDAVAPVASAMREADASFKIIGLDLLGRIKGDRAKAHIRSFLSDANMHVRRAARQALSRF